MICVYPYPREFEPEAFCRFMFGTEIPAIFHHMGFIPLRDATSALRYLCPLRTKVRAEVTFIRKAACWGVQIRAANEVEERLARIVVEQALKTCQRNCKLALNSM